MNDIIFLNKSIYVIFNKLQKQRIDKSFIVFIQMNGKLIHLVELKENFDFYSNLTETISLQISSFKYI